MNLQIGDTFTLAGVYKKETLWQIIKRWWRNEPRPLATLRVTAQTEAYSEFREE